MLAAHKKTVLNAAKARPFARVFRLGLFATILTYLLFQLSRIGWSEIAGELPTSPLFYALSLGFVAAPVLAEIFAFQTITGRKAFGQYKIFLRKQVLNKAVMNFSGDAFLIHKLSQDSGMSLKRAAIILKDMTLIRAFSANLWIVILVIAAAISGNFDVLKNVATTSPVLAVLISLFCLGICGGAILLFRKLTRLSSTTALKVAAIYLARSAVIGAVLMAQWSLASAGTALATWFVFLIVFSLAKKSPVGGELLFATVIVSLPGLAAGSATIAAMLIAIAAVTQVIYMFGFLISVERKPRGASDCAPALQPA
jgi:hypothetical protein